MRRISLAMRLTEQPITAVFWVTAPVVTSTILFPSSAICEAFGWERGADRSWDEAPVYRGIFTTIIGISAVLVLMPGVDLFQIMMTSQVINGVLLPVVLVFQVVIAADRHIMGANRNGRVWNVLTWATIAVITVLTVVMFVLQAMGYSA